MASESERSEREGSPTSSQPLSPTEINDASLRLVDLAFKVRVLLTVIAVAVGALAVTAAVFVIVGAVHRTQASDRAKRCADQASDSSGVPFVAISACVDAARLGLLDGDGLLVTPDGSPTETGFFGE